MTTDEWERRQQLELADRLREIRKDVYGEYGGQVLADAGRDYRLRPGWVTNPESWCLLKLFCN